MSYEKTKLMNLEDGQTLLGAIDGKMSDLKSAIGTAIEDIPIDYTDTSKRAISIADKAIVTVSGAALYATAQSYAITVSEGETYRINASASGTDRALYAFGDETGILSTYPAEAFADSGTHTLENKIIVIPTGITKLFISRYSSSGVSKYCAKVQNSEKGKVDKLNNDVGFSIINLGQFTRVNARISSNTGKAVVDGTKNLSRQYDITNVKEIAIKANTNHVTACSFLAQSAVGITDGETPVYATGETIPHIIAVGTTETLTVPTGAVYMLLTEKSLNIGGYLPDYVHVIYGGLAEKVYSIKIDSTLTKQDECADAKVTGNEISYLKNDIYHNVSGDAFEWIQGGYNATNGSAASSDYLIRLPDVTSKDIRFVSCDTGYLISAFGFSGSTYIGMWKNGEAFSTSVSSGTLKYESLDLRELMKTATVINLRMEKSDGSDITPEVASHVTFSIIGTLETNPCQYEWKFEASTFDKILCIGDSLIEGGSNTPNIEPDPANAKRTVARNTYSIPRFLEKMFGIATTNWGISGSTSRSWYNSKSVSEPDWGGYDGALIYIGSNDYTYITTGGMTIEEATATSRTYIGNIITKLKTDNPGIRIFLCTLNPNTTAGELAPYRIPLMEAIRDIAENDDSVFCIDLNTYSSFKSGSAYSNGHPTAIGYQWMAREIGAYMCWWIANHPKDFKWIRYIGTQYAVVSGDAPEQDDDGGYEGDVE